MYNTRSQARAAFAPAFPARPGNGGGFSSDSKSVSSQSESSFIDNRRSITSENQYNEPKIKVVKWLQLLLDPILEGEHLIGSPNGLKRRVTLDAGETRSSASSVALEHSEYALGDRIRLLIPYADTTLKWTFSFCWMDPSLPPEIFFDDGFEPDYYNYEEHYNWNAFSSRHCLLEFVRRLFREYREYQLDLCESRENLKRELSMLRELSIVEDTFDIYMYQEGARRGDVVAVFPIVADAIAKLPAKYMVGQSVNDLARLKIRWSFFGNGKVHTDLELTAFMNKLLIGKYIKLPAMNCLAEYIPEIMTIINEAVTTIGDAYKFRRSLIIALIAVFPRGSLLEYCNDDFMSANFLLEHEDFKFIFSASFGRNDPANRTILCSCRSVYHEMKDSTGRLRRPLVQSWNLPLRNCAPEEAAKKIQDFIGLKIQEFKRNSCQEGK